MDQLPLQPAFHGSVRLLVLLHALAAIVLLGSATHQAVVTAGQLRGHDRPRLARVYAVTCAAAYAVTFLLGAAAYPSYRYHTRALYLDRYAVWASNLFDIKENFASLGLPLVLGALLLTRWVDPQQPGAGPLLTGRAVLVFGTAFVVWFDAVSGLLITLAKGVGG
jgi:hypothetical protein